MPVMKSWFLPSLFVSFIMHCVLLQIVGKLQHVIFANFKAVILLVCVILIRCDALAKESAMPAIPACANAFVHPDPCKKFLCVYILHMLIPFQGKHSYKSILVICLRPKNCYKSILSKCLRPIPLNKLDE